eukprot:TRINITY_DN15527_c0_g1_i1.p1 TRINITY_DN15527_c0_g1~~TRINITY_DN15527_c0_g1_i1.p1  ORF type:complete len:465 (-),score=82.72 TRINITY_DN15527_c0_g1_i1:37-1371(-)
MGNAMHVGHALAMVPGMDSGNTALRVLMEQYNIRPWDARALMDHYVQRQRQLARTSAFRLIDVSDGLHFYTSYFTRHMGRVNEVAREAFVQLSLQLFAEKGLRFPSEEAHLLYDIFDAINLSRTGVLTTLELVTGLSCFFAGTVEQQALAVFDVLDMNCANGLPKSSLADFLRPCVWCMVPESAAVLRPLLLNRVTNQLFSQITFDAKDSISRSEFVSFVCHFPILDSTEKNIEVAITQASCERTGGAEAQRAGAHYGPDGLPRQGRSGMNDEAGFRAPTLLANLSQHRRPAGEKAADVLEISKKECLYRGREERGLLLSLPEEHEAWEQGCKQRSLPPPPPPPPRQRRQEQAPRAASSPAAVAEAVGLMRPAGLLDVLPRSCSAGVDFGAVVGGGGGDPLARALAGSFPAEATPRVAYGPSMPRVGGSPLPRSGKAFRSERSA